MIPTWVEQHVLINFLMDDQPINIFPSRGGAVVKTLTFTPLLIYWTYGRQVSYILYYEGRFNSTTECSNGPSCCNRMFKWGRESRCFLRRPLFEDRPWSDENGLQTLSWSYKNSFSWFTKWSTVGHQVRLLSDEDLWTYFYLLSIWWLQSAFANFHKSWTKCLQVALQTFMNSTKVFEH